MRRGNGAEFISTEDERIAGVCLGADYVSEHEWGIKDLRRSFGMNDGEIGIARRTITKHPIKWYSKTLKNKSTIAGFSSYEHWDETKKPNVDEVFRIGEILEPYESKIRGKSEIYYGKLQTAWDSRGFCAFSANPIEQSYLKTIYEAILVDDAIIMIGRGQVFQNGGLNIGILSLIPQSVKDAMEHTDLEAMRLEEEFAATGIESRLKAAGKKWYALSPRFQEDGSIRVWLNPQEQHLYDSGWMTIQDLDDWIAGTGKAIKKGK